MYYKPIFVLFHLFIALNSLIAQSPPGFSQTDFTNWDQPLSFAFDKQGRMFVVERVGRVYKYENAQKVLLLDITEEVASYGDFGLMGITIDPDFEFNGKIYLYYVVDRHHLLYFGTGNYNSGQNEQGATIARLTRYTLDANTGFGGVVPNSRSVLLGNNINNGVPITGIWHAGGDLNFSVDGTLLVSTGDGAAGADYESQALTNGIITQAEYNNRRRWRCQMPNSLSGKILRIDPNTGNGIPSNPFFETNNPNSAASKVWAIGFRNPFRFTIKPNTGDHNSALGQPGTLIVADVGQGDKEEIDIITQAGQNFGWPKYEGVNLVFESNPIFEPVVQKNPTVEWDHYSASARVMINGVVQNVGSTAFPYSNFYGKCAIGGVFYEGSQYPPTYQNAYFFSDFNDNWVKVINLDASNNPTHKIDFDSNIGGVLKWAYNPINQSIYYLSAQGNIARIKYESGQNQSPVAGFNLNKSYGTSPLAVSFDASESYDPEYETLTYNWNFGDNTSSTGKNVNHTFTSSNSGPSFYTVTLTVTDTFGNSATTQRKVSLNNTPPKIISTSVDTLTKFSPGIPITLDLSAIVTDAEESVGSLTYKWEVYLYHNEHRHLEYLVQQSVGSYMIEPIECDNNSYFYQVRLIVSDSYGLSSTIIKNIYQNCLPIDTSPPVIPEIAVENFKLKAFTLRWSNLFDDNGVKSLYLQLNDNTIRLQPTATSYEYKSIGPIIGQNFEAQILVIDNAGNVSKSAKLRFMRPPIICTGQVFLSNLTPISATNGNGPIEIDKSTNTTASNDGNPIIINGVLYTKGLGVHANSRIEYDLGNYTNTTFSAKIGLDDEIGESCGSVIFKIYKDNILAYTSPTILPTTPVVDINLNIEYASVLKLEVLYANDNYNCDHANWAAAQLLPTCASEDFQAPSSIFNLTSQIENSIIKTSWNRVTDNLQNAIQYEIFIDDSLVTTQADTSFNFTNFPNGYHEITVQAKDIYGNLSGTNSFLFKCNESIINPSLAVNYNCNENCNDMKSIKSGNWADPNIWFCNKSPKVTDLIKISDANIVTLSKDAEIKGISFGLGSELIIESNFKLELHE